MTRAGLPATTVNGAHVGGDHRARADDRALADRHARQDAGVEPDPDVAADRGPAAPAPPPSRRRGRARGTRRSSVAPRVRIERHAVGVHQHHVPGDQRVVADLDLGVADDPRAVDQRVVAQRDPPAAPTSNIVPR